MKVILSFAMTIMLFAAGLKQRFVAWLLENSNAPKTLEDMASAPLEVREAWANMVLRDVHIRDMLIGENTVKLDGTNNRIEISTTSTTLTTAGQMGVNTSTGEPLWYDDAGTAEKSMVDHGDMLGLSDDDHTIYFKADCSRNVSGNIDLTSTYKVVNSAAPTSAGDLVNKTYSDLPQRLAPVSVIEYIGTRTITQIDALSPGAGWSVVAGDAGTPSAGSSDALSTGDIAEYDGTQWKKIVANSGGYPPDDTRAAVSVATLYSPLTGSTDEGKVAEWDGTSLTPALTSPAQGDTLVTERPSSGTVSYNANRAFAFSGSVPTGGWVQYGGNGMDHGLMSGLSDDDHTQYFKADGTRQMSGNIDLNNNKVTNSAAPSASGDLTTKSYVDSLVSGLNWLDPTDVKSYIGTRTIAEINALSPSEGWSVVAGDAGTPTAGTSDALVAGDIAEYDGTQWKKIITNASNFPPDGTRALCGDTETLYSPLTDATDNGKIAEWDGTSLTPALTSPSDGNALLIKAEGSVNENKQYVFDGTVPSGTWVQFGGVGMDHGALSGLGDDDHTQYALLAGRSGGQALTGGTAASNELLLESTSHATKGTITMADGTDVLMKGDDAWYPNTDTEGSVGTSGNRFGDVYAVTVTSGDLVLHDPEKGAKWRLIEEVNYIRLINEVTGNSYRMVMEPEVEAA